MNLAALSVTLSTNEPEMTFARHQRNSQKSTLVVVIIRGDGELLTSTRAYRPSEETIYSLIEINRFESIAEYDNK